MRRDLMALLDGTAHPPCVRLFEDRSKILTVHEKRGLDAFGFQNVQNGIGVGMGPIVKGQGDRAGHGTLGDDLSHRDGGHLPVA